MKVDLSRYSGKVGRVSATRGCEMGASGRETHVFPQVFHVLRSIGNEMCSPLSTLTAIV